MGTQIDVNLAILILTKLLDELLDQDPLVHTGTVHGEADVNNLVGAANLNAKKSISVIYRG